MTLPAGNRQAETDRCYEAAEQHRQQQNELLQAIRSAHAAEESSLLAYAGVRSGVVLIVLSMVGLGATFWAAFAASSAAIYAKDAATETKRGADAAQRSADAAHEQLDAVRVAERAYIMMDLHATSPVQGGFRFHVANIGRTFAHVDEVRYALREKLPKSPKLDVRLQRLELDLDLAEGHSDGLGPSTPVGPRVQHIVGYVRYFSVYKQAHRTYFRYDRTHTDERQVRWVSSGGKKWNRTADE